MRRVLVLFLIAMLSLSSAAPVLAHGGEEGGTVDAAGYIKQAIVFLEGIQDIDTAAMDIQKAMKAEGSDVLDQSKLNQALTALQKPDIEQTKVLLVQALDKDPKNAPELSLRPDYRASSANTAFLGLAGVFVILGAVVVRKVKASH
ncbi:hypothetical protein [Paradesulfitobacterium ferrireducens]|uniref:hypothetical protein n=1 Tax=Paradesulfitobacterium ferrireducens TaxID=2816476 RepID=UPI001A8C8432|nr:hypothetical protein [Paradesulfitobacterium ferrireducens]